MKRLLLLASTCVASPLFGQNLDPRSFVNTPVGINFLIVGYGYSTGNVLFDPAIALEDADLTLQGPSAGYARALDLWGLSGKADAALGWACADGTATFNGAPASRHVCGLSDPTAHISVNFIGAPALTLRQYPAYRQNILVGAGLRVTAPLGQYDPTKLVNIGTNRWSFKPEIGVSKVVGPWTLEIQVAATFFTDNADFYGGKTRSQDPLYSLQGHLIYGFRSGVWVSVDGTYFAGGRTTVDGVLNNDLQQNWRAGATLALPVVRANSIKLYASSGVSARTGNNYDLVGVAWQYRWGGGL